MSILDSNPLLVEFVSYVAPDGAEYPIFGGRRSIISWRDFGAPPIDYLSDSGPNQHGSTIRDFRYRERTLSVRLYDRGKCRRLNWWCSEGKLIDILRPNRSSTAQPGKIVIVLPDGTQREIFARLQRGPSANWDGLGDNHPYDMNESVDFICSDPFWRDSTQNSETFVLIDNDGCLPTCLPTCLSGASVINESVDLSYTGTWDGDQITISLTGPMASPVISNDTTGQEIKFNYTISDGETVTVNIQPTVTTVTNNSGQNLIGTIDNISDLTTFYLTTEGDLTSDGTNTIRVFATETTAKTTIIISWYTRHISAAGGSC